jgi:hypothetical protein
MRLWLADGGGVPLHSGGLVGGLAVLGVAAVLMFALILIARCLDRDHIQVAEFVSRSSGERTQEHQALERLSTRRTGS